MENNKKIIMIDTNFFLIPWQFKVDIFSEFEKLFTSNYTLVIFNKVTDELNAIINSKNTTGKNKAASKFALDLINLMSKKNKLKIINTQKLEKEFQKYSIKTPNVDILLIFNIIKELNETMKKTVISSIEPILLRKNTKNIKIRKDLKRKTIATLKNISKLSINSNNLFIATQDKALRNVLKILNISIIELKQKKYLRIKN